MSLPPTLHRRNLFILLTVGAIGSAMVVPYFLQRFPESVTPLGYVPTLVLLAAISAGITVLAVVAGYRWGLGIGLGAPRLQSWADDRADPGGWANSFQWAVPLSIALTGFIWVAENYWLGGRFLSMYEESLSLVAFGAVIYAGTAEELVLRLFAMTAAARLFLRLGMTRNNALVFALFTSALLSALFHLPANLRTLDDAWVGLGHAVFHHGVSGLVFGWLFWRRGIESAMICHGLTAFLIRLAV